MGSIAFLTSASLPDGISDDKPLKEAFENVGHEVSFAVWSDDQVDWRRFAAVLIRSTWDYYQRGQDFFSTLEKISRVTKLCNSLDCVRWNADKNYLIELQSHGVAVVPTFTADDVELAERAAQLLLKKERSIIIKPALSAGAYLTSHVNSENEIAPAIEAVLKHSEMLLQPYIASVARDGEISLIYFRDGDKWGFSHAVLKTASPGEFRVQIEFGGGVQEFSPSQGHIDLGLQALRFAPGTSLYARVDIVDWRVYPRIGEVEMIEPELFFSYAPGAAARMLTVLNT